MTMIGDLVTKSGLMLSGSLSDPCREKFGETIDHRAERLDTILGEFNKKAADIDRSGRFTAIGKADALTQLRRDFAKRIEAERHVPGLEAAAAKGVKVPTRIARPNREGIDAEMQECRAFLIDADPLERGELVKRAAERGEAGRTILASIDMDPLAPVREIVSPEIMAAARETFAITMDSAAFEAKCLAEEALQTHLANVAKAYQIVGGGVPEKDEVAAAVA